MSVTLRSAARAELALGAGVLGAAAVVWATLQMRRLRRTFGVARALASRGRAYQRPLHAAQARVIVLGDSTGVGLGGDAAQASIAALLAQHHPQVDVRNAAVIGARVPDVPAQLERCAPHAERFDLALVHVGGNDAMRSGRAATIAREADTMLRAVCRRARAVVWLGPANVGLAPVFLPPLSWWLSARMRRLRAVYADAARRAGVHYVDFFAERGADIFSGDVRQYYARDALHPSDAGYRHCFRVVAPLLGRLLAPPRPAP